MLSVFSKQLFATHRRIKLCNVCQPIMPKFRVEQLENVEDEDLEFPVECRVMLQLYYSKTGVANTSIAIDRSIAEC